jgi:hypothetical protein
MEIVRIAETDLPQERPKRVRQLLAPLTGNSQVPCELVPGLVHGGKVIAARDERTPNHYRDWVFRSSCSDIVCQYFELWRPCSKAREWYLDRAYLHLFFVDRTLRQNRELLSVHADPNNQDTEPIKGYKTGPHLHVHSSIEPLPRAHIPLAMGYVKTCVESLSELTRVFDEVVSVLSHDVIGRFTRT